MNPRGRIVVFGHAVDVDRIREVAEQIRASGYACSAFPLADDVETWWNSNLKVEISTCNLGVFVSSRASSDCPAVDSCVAMIFSARKPIVPFRLDMSPYSSNISYCLATRHYIDVVKEGSWAASKLLAAIDRVLCSPTPSVKSPGWRKWVIAGGVALVAIWVWWAFVREVGFVRSLEPILEATFCGVCEECSEDMGSGRVQLVMLDVVTGDYAALECRVKDGAVRQTPRDEARKHAALEPHAVDRLMIPVLAATAMRHGGVEPSVALGAGDWRASHVAEWNRMLEEKTVLKGLSSFHLETVLRGRGVAAEARRYAVTPYHQLRGLLGIVGEAGGCPGFDYCGGANNARRILSKMRYDDGLGLLTGTLLCDTNVSEENRGMKSCTIAGAVGFEDTCCMLYVRLEAQSADTDFDIAAEALDLWHTFGLVAKAADEKWGGNGR